MIGQNVLTLEQAQANYQVISVNQGPQLLSHLSDSHGYRIQTRLVFNICGNFKDDMSKSIEVKIGSCNLARHLC